MKVTVEQSALLKSLAHVHRVVERRNTIPILSNVLLKAFGGSLQLKATDLDIEVVETLRRAQEDDRVKGVFVRLPEGGMAPAAADELRFAIKHIRAKGKPVFAHSQGLYPSGSVASTYMLGASTDAFWMQPDSSFQAVGLASQDLFLKRAFDKYGVKADFAQRYEYKKAVNGYLYDDYTAAHREATLGWMTSVYTSALNTASAV
jgi:protease-4